MARSSQVKPNERGYITVKINTAGRKGRIIENVEVLCNDSQMATITLTIQAYVMEMDIFPLRK